MRKFLPFLLVVVALAARLVPGPRTIDDAYITFRYARNLLAGEGFVFNPGERVQGTTTPLYTLLMAGLGPVSGGTQAPFPWLALGVNALADAGTCLLLYWMGRRLGAGAAGFSAALVWAVAPYSVTFAIGGLETSLYMLLLSGLAAAYLGRRRTLVGLCAALALLIRPDAVLLVGPLVLDRFYRALRGGEKLEWGELLAFTLPCLAWGAFATAYFGSPIPHSVQAKLAVYRLGENAALIRLIQHYATPFMEYDTLGAIGTGIGLLLYPFLYLIGARRAWRAERRTLVYLVYPWLYLLVFALPNPLLFRWYLTPPLPPYFLFILMGAEQLLSGLFRLRAKLPLPAWRRWTPLAILAILPLAFCLNTWQQHPDHGPDRPAPAMAWFKLELLYRQAADFLAPRLSANSRLAAGDVGVLGFYTPARILDTVGLNSPESLRYYPLDEKYYVINYAIPSQLILTEQPDYVVILEVYGRKTLLAEARFQQQYTLLHTIPTDIYGSQGMLIFEKN
jgi:4-amino-4-deoxy-L-arabinose transferase-like glycosyltransferase